jgi:inward rectifier potassium channel
MTGAAVRNIAPKRRVRVTRNRRDGTMRVRIGAYELSKRGVARYDLRDPYYLAVALSWPWFLLLVLALELTLNAIFAALYMIQPGSVANAHPGSFGDHFFFSIETLATVGYGVMAPATVYGHIISSAEVIVGMGLTALVTGLAFVRFSRPRPKIIYADKAVVARHRGRRTLMIRIANARLTPLTDATARLAVILADTSPEGQLYRTVHELELTLDRMPLFALSWTVMHVLNEKSPLYGCDAAWIRENDVRLVLTLQARDPVLATDVHESYSYGPEAIVVGMRYAEAVSIDANGHPIADLTRISLLEPEVIVEAVIEETSGRDAAEHDA